MRPAALFLRNPIDDIPKDSLTVRSRNDRQRQTRRRDSDDSFYGNTPEPVSFPSFSASLTAPEVEATVSWFNAEKGFGFVALTDGSGDAFLHINTLQASGLQTVAAGSRLMVRVGAGQKGRQVDQIVSVSEAAPEAQRASQPARGPRSDGPRRPDPGPAVEMTGTVKWYNPEKGFGFITPNGGGKDVFVHATALERAGLSALTDGQAVRMGIVQGAKGPEVATISLG